MSNPFKYFNSSPEVIRLVVMMYVRYPLSLRNVEDLLAERGIDISHETIRFWWNRFGPIFAAEIVKKRVAHIRGYTQWRWHLDEVFVRINGKLCYLWRAVDHEGEVLETVVTAKRDQAAALKSLKCIMKKYGRPRSIVTDRLCSYSAAMLPRRPGHRRADPVRVLAWRRGKCQADDALGDRGVDAILRRRKIMSLVRTSWWS
jgi:putative transposase